MGDIFSGSVPPDGVGAPVRLRCFRWTPEAFPRLYPTPAELHLQYREPGGVYWYFCWALL
eukprot:8751769-Pyramimonas_sp.AAC.1